MSNFIAHLSLSSPPLMAELSEEPSQINEQGTEGILEPRKRPHSRSVSNLIISVGYSVREGYWTTLIIFMYLWKEKWGQN